MEKLKVLINTKNNSKTHLSFTVFLLQFATHHFFICRLTYARNFGCDWGWFLSIISCIWEQSDDRPADHPYDLLQKEKSFLLYVMVNVIHTSQHSQFTRRKHDVAVNTFPGEKVRNLMNLNKDLKLQEASFFLRCISRFTDADLKHIAENQPSCSADIYSVCMKSVRQC